MKIDFKKRPKSTGKQSPSKQSPSKQSPANNNLPVLASDYSPYSGMILTKVGLIKEIKSRMFKFLFNWICSQVAMSTNHKDLFSIIEAKTIASELNKVFNKLMALASDKDSKVTKKELQLLVINSCKDIATCMKQEISLLDIDL